MSGRTDRFWLWLHRFSARKAQRIYARSPKYISNYEAGVAAGRSRFERAIKEGNTRSEYR